MPSSLLLTNSTTILPKATLVPVIISPAVDVPGGAARKASFVSSLQLQAGEVAAVRSALTVAAAASVPTAIPDGVYELLTQFEGSPPLAQLPSPAVFVTITDSALRNFGNALAAVRQESLIKAETADAGAVAALVNVAVVGTAAFWNSINAPLAPVGMLNLESLQMTPAGLERGGLLATVPLAPGERTEVVQQEWSVISDDYTSVVTDSLENYSETGVTDNTQLTQSTNSQTSHSNQFNVTATASGGIPLVTGASASTGFTSQDQSSQSATASATHAQQTTQKASSRSIQSHKITISTTSSSGSSEATTRMLMNPSITDPMRIDYFSIMRMWQVSLYRYGLRLTYDITVPEPGAALREAYMQLAELQAQAEQTFVFDMAYADISVLNYQDYAVQYGANVPNPPDSSQLMTVGGTQVQGLSTSGGVTTYWPLTFTIPPGYWISNFRLVAQIGGNYAFRVMGYSEIWDGAHNNQPPFIDQALVDFMTRAEGDQTVTCYFNSANPAMVQFWITVEPTDPAMAARQSQVWNALYNAAQSTFYTQQQTVSAQIQALQDKLSNVDTLTLRREENDEIMKCVLRWLLGSSFEFMPQQVVNYFNQSSSNQDDLNYGVGFTGNSTQLTASQWTVLGFDEETASFINQAIDWDSTLFFLYSYFWDVPQSWDFIRQIQHSDATRQAFLRAGSARVVLCVRQGWETAWTQFVEFWSATLEGNLPAHPYLAIAQQIESYDSTNYPGIPPANPAGPYDPNTPQAGTTCDATLEPSTAQVVIPVASNAGFVVGATAIIDSWASGIQETQQTMAVSADGTTITVQALTNAHSPGGDANDPYPIVQAGAQGVLIAEWFEYTPTSGTDIAVTSNLADIS